VTVNLGQTSTNEKNNMYKRPWSNGRIKLSSLLGISNKKKKKKKEEKKKKKEKK
jgi:hypothetical protein